MYLILETLTLISLCVQGLQNKDLDHYNTTIKVFSHFVPDKANLLYNAKNTKSGLSDLLKSAKTEYSTMEENHQINYIEVIEKYIEDFNIIGKNDD